MQITQQKMEVGNSWTLVLKFWNIRTGHFAYSVFLCGAARDLKKLLQWFYSNKDFEGGYESLVKLEAINIGPENSF